MPTWFPHFADEIERITPVPGLPVDNAPVPHEPQPVEPTPDSPNFPGEPDPAAIDGA